MVVSLTDRKEYHDVLRAAEIARELPFGYRVFILNLVTAFYWACVLFHRRMFRWRGAQVDIHRQAVTCIVRIGYYHHEQGKNFLNRFKWPLLMAAIETTDATDRSWLLQRLRDASDNTTEGRWICRAAEEIARLQNAPGASWVDLAQFMQGR